MSLLLTWICPAHKFLNRFVQSTAYQSRKKNEQKLFLTEGMRYARSIHQQKFCFEPRHAFVALYQRL